ncbi:hypothetical protein CFP56_003783 [Quercus suber]|uniref:Uncharacterized protein n=1 Tax=Quercus suber TaxID=58331 RepID=A0AAW0LDY7_QUESU
MPTATLGPGAKNENGDQPQPPKNANAAEDLGTKAYGKKSKIYRMKPPRVAGSLLLNSTEDLVENLCAGFVVVRWITDGVGKEALMR